MRELKGGDEREVLVRSYFLCSTSSRNYRLMADYTRVDSEPILSNHPPPLEYSSFCITFPPSYLPLLMHKQYPSRATI
jgi:hypothetical protein